MGTLYLDADIVKRHLADPWQVLTALGLAEGAKRQQHGFVISCPWHNERSPSCSVRLGPDGTLAVHCFACDQGGDVFALVCAVSGLDPRRDFVRGIEEAARLGGLTGSAQLLPPSRRLLV